jgi:peptidoglycan/LPS O-acetylase OafA/YrhL
LPHLRDITVRHALCCQETTTGGDMSDTATPALNRRLDALTGLRFIAALGVVLFHTVSNGALSDPLFRFRGGSAVVSLGYLGVTFFFVLSGFVLTWSHKEDQPPKRFLWNRFARVYPLHFATLLATAVAIVAAGNHLSIPIVIGCLLLVQAWSFSSNWYFGVNGVSWSLSCEAFFYLLLPGLASRLGRLGHRAQILAGTAALTAMIIFSLLFDAFKTTASHDEALWIFPLFSLGAFILGVVAAQTMRAGHRPKISFRTAAILTLGVYALLSGINGMHKFGLFASDHLSRAFVSAVFAPVAGLLIACAAADELDGKLRLLRSRWLVRLGEWSFALYLVHPLLIRTQSGATAVAGLLAFLAAVVACSAAAHYLVEKPCERYLRAGGLRASKTGDSRVERGHAQMGGSAAETGHT